MIRVRPPGSPETVMPSASRTITIDRPPETVFEFIADGTTATQWRPGLKALLET